MAERQDFLDAEEMLKRVTSTLEELTAEVGRYKEAKEKLQQADINISHASEGIEKVTEGLSEVAWQAKEVLSKLGDIGTPKLIEAYSSLEEETKALSKKVGKQQIVLYIGFFAVLALIAFLILKP